MIGMHVCGVDILDTPRLIANRLQVAGQSASSWYKRGADTAAIFNSLLPALIRQSFTEVYPG